MKKVIIPRKDHEVYFLSEPEKIKNNKLLRLYVNDQMKKLHPAFSSRTLADVKRVSLNGKAWLMVTVMDEELLAEYRVLHGRSYFFTNTSIMAGKKGFAGSGVQVIGDEKIGFDAERNEPLSVPLETGDGNGKREKENGNMPKRCSVFRKKMPPWLATAIGIAVSTAFLLPIIFFIQSQRKQTMKAENVLARFPDAKQMELETALKTLPSHIEMLASVSADIVNAGGRIQSWRGNAVSDPFVAAIIQGINIANIIRIFDSYGFVMLEDIREIRYEGSQPYINVFLKMDGYASAPEIPYPMRGFAFTMISDLVNSLGNIDITVISETLPSAGNNYLDYTVSFQAVGWNLVKSLEIISSFCAKYALQVKNLDIQITGTSLFTASCTLSHCDIMYIRETVLGDEINYIPAAFGFLEEKIAAKPAIIEAGEKEPLAVPVIGSIKDSGSVTTFYRDSTDGKIQVVVENER